LDCLTFSVHGHGGRALIGTYDHKKTRFHPKKFYRMILGPVYKHLTCTFQYIVDSLGECLAIYNIRENITRQKEVIIPSPSPQEVAYGVMSLSGSMGYREAKTLE